VYLGISEFKRSFIITVMSCSKYSDCVRTFPRNCGIRNQKRFNHIAAGC
jgi:hypothetical protein